MSTDHLTGAPSFDVHGVTWRCWSTDDGQRLEWRSTCGRFRAGRDRTFCWSVFEGRIIEKSFRTLREAMAAAIDAGER